MIGTGLDVVLAEIALAAGAIYAGLKRAWVATAALAAGALLVLEEAVRSLTS